MAGVAKCVTGSTGGCDSSNAETPTPGYQVLSVKTASTLKTTTCGLAEAVTYGNVALFGQCALAPSGTTRLSLYVDQYCGGEAAAHCCRPLLLALLLLAADAALLPDPLRGASGRRAQRSLAAAVCPPPCRSDDHADAGCRLRGAGRRLLGQHADPRPLRHACAHLHAPGHLQARPAGQLWSMGQSCRRWSCWCSCGSAAMA